LKKGQPEGFGLFLMAEAAKQHGREADMAKDSVERNPLAPTFENG
jgi:hypothetical protein